MNYWLFQGNPKYYRVLDSIKDFEQMPWLVTRYSKDIAVGDGVLIWVAGKEAGIYAIAEIIDTTKILENVPDTEYWLDKTKIGKPQAQIKFTQKLLGKPLLKEDLKKDEILGNLLILRAPNSTNFKVTFEEWEQVHKLL